MNSSIDYNACSKTDALRPLVVVGLVIGLFLFTPTDAFSANEFSRFNTSERWWHGAFFGAILVLILINFGQYGITKESPYLYYGGFLSTLSLSLASWLGYFANSWIERGALEPVSLTLLVYLTFIAYGQFCRSYFHLQDEHRLWNSAIHCLSLVTLFAAVISINTPIELSNTLLADVGILTATLLFILSVVMVIENAPHSQTFLLTRLIITPPTIALAFSTFRFVPWSNDIYGLLMTALCIEALILTYSLIDNSVKNVQHRLQNHHNQSLKHVLLLSQIKTLRSMSREIRSPISGVIGMAQLLQDTSLTRNQKDQVQTIQHSGEALLKWLNRLSNWSAIQTGRVQLSSVPFDLGALVGESIDDHSEYATDRHVSLKLELDRRLPSLVNGDPERVKQILAGLLGHALFYSEQGHLLLTVKPSYHNHQWDFILSDSHSGLQELEIEALHNDLDYSSHSAAQQDWYIAQQLSKSMQGKLSVAINLLDTPEQRVLYTLELKLPRHTLLQHNEADYDQLLRGKRLLIVDNSIWSRKLLTKRAESWGMRVHGVPCGADAFAYLKAQEQNRPCDIIVLDQDIPDISGLELAAQLYKTQAMAKGATLIMLSGAGTMPSAEDAAARGIRRVLHKPITANSLKITLAEELTLAQNRQAHPKN